MTVAFDLDGVLAVGPPADIFPKPWARMTGWERRQRQVKLIEHYAAADALWRPLEERFAVITARKDDPDVRATTRAWLEQKFPGRVSSLHMLRGSRTLANVVLFKAMALRSLAATDFSEDNPDVVRALRKMQLPCRIWLFRNGSFTLPEAA